MKVLLLSVTAGGGHNSTANALAARLREAGAEVKIADAYRDCSGRLMYTVVSQGYLLAVFVFRHLYGLFYRFFEKRRGNAYRSSPARLSKRGMAKRLSRLIEEYAPDAVVCTHCFAANLLDVAKERYGLSAVTVGIVTDFTVHPYWEEALRLDRIILPDERLAPAARKKGFSDEQILSLGIPIHPKFATVYDKKEAAISLGLDPEQPILLLMNGSMGYGSMVRTVKHLDRLSLPLQIIAVCGSNKRALRSIKRKKFRHPVLACGFVSNVETLMAASDLIVTKPGGLTASEALAKNLPLIISTPIPGHEDRNASFLTEQGAGILAKKPRAVADAVTLLLSDENRLAEAGKAAAALGKPNATEDLAREILRPAGEK